MERKNAWKTYTANELEHLEQTAAAYKLFLDEGKTERECVSYFVREAEKAGYRSLESYMESGEQIKAGDKVYAINMKKTMVMFQVGTGSLEKGMNILGAHIDSPRLDLKQNPLYEDTDFVYLDTHYYGGIKKYQWPALPLALHGVIYKSNGEVVTVKIGEEENDPVFVVTDLLPHLADEQYKRPANKLIKGEELNILIGSRPFKDDEKSENVKLNIMYILNEKYGITEEDFISAELECVPAFKAKDIGFDRSMIGAYGQDDRVCAYTSMMAMLDVDKTERTVCCILVDKEEIGSVGATGMQSRFFENSLAELMNLTGEYSELNLRRCLSKSCMLSSDVSSAFDPTYASSFDKKNVAYLGGGMVFNKFTGARGKSGSNDANAEYLAHLRDIFEKESINFQSAELGRVDLGGGGTIAYILALYGMNVIDSGVAVLNMHAPWEATSKADVYETYRGYMAFVKNAGM